MRFLLLLTLICAPAMWGCCPTDRDDFERAAAFGIISGKIERPVPDFRQSFSVRANNTPVRVNTGAEAETTPQAEAAEPAQAEQNQERSVSRTWITLGVLLVLLVLGSLTKMRISRSATQVINDPETPEARS